MWLSEWLKRMLGKKVESREVWTVDRDGRVRRPERKVVLRAKPQTR